MKTLSLKASVLVLLLSGGIGFSVGMFWDTSESVNSLLSDGAGVARRKGEVASGKSADRSLEERILDTLALPTLQERTEQWIILLDEGAAGKVPYLLDIIASEPSAGLHRFRRDVEWMLVVWLDQERWQVFDYYLQAQGQNCRFLREFLIESWFVDASITEIMESLKKFADTSERGRFLAELTRAMALVDPLKAFEISNGEGVGGAKSVSALSEIYENWSKINPLEAWGHAAAQNISVDELDYMLQGISGQWAQDDPCGAFHWIMTLSSGLKTTALDSFFVNLADQNPELAGRYLSEIEDPDERELMSRSLLGTWARTDYQAALAWVDAHVDGKHRARSQYSVLRILARSQPEVVSGLIDSMRYGDLRDDLIINLADSWTASDAHAAMNWMDARPDVYERTLGVASVLKRWAYLDPQMAADYLSAREDGHRYYDAARVIAAKLAETEPRAAAEWVTDLEISKNAQMNLISEMIYHWGSQEPEEAIVFVQMNAEDPGLAPNQKREILTNMIDGLVAKDPIEAAKWVESLEEDSVLKEGAIQGLALSWTAKDTFEASQWIADLPPSASTDSAITVLVESVKAKDPQVALSWANTIQDSNARLNNIMEVLSVWRIQDSTAAQEALANIADLEPGEKESIAEMFWTDAIQ